jgi:hypothetical protein
MNNESTNIRQDASLRIKYVGERFNGGRLPLDVLADLPALRDLLIAYAKEQWRAGNSDRSRVPKGFEQSLSFDLTAIEDGSAIPQLTWDQASAQKSLPGFTAEIQDVIESSFSKIIHLIDRAAHQDFPKALGSEYVRALNKLGSSLRDGEKIEFLGKTGREGNVVYLDPTRRKQLITKVRETYEARFEGTGQLLGNFVNDPKTGRIDIATTEHGVIAVPIEKDRVIDEFDGCIGSTVQFDLVIELDNLDKFQNVAFVHAIGLIDEGIAGDFERCKNRLDELAKLNDDWDGEGAIAIRDSVIEAAKKLLAARPHLCSKYKIFPTAVGGILLEFEYGTWDISVEFDADAGIEIFGIEIDGAGEFQTNRFPAMNQEFLNEFDRIVVRNDK